MRGFVHITSEISNNLHEALEIFDELYSSKKK
jgi:hypothetical protein